MMDHDSPFATHRAAKPIKPTTTVHVNFCNVCHHVWKAPTAAKTCVNCKGNGECARSLIAYTTEAFVL